MRRLQDLLPAHEQWLMERIQHYAKGQGFSKHAPTLVEVWRLSISGLTAALVKAVEAFGDRNPEFHADDDHTRNPIAEFGLAEARLHRKRGVSLGMFLGLFKYYRQAYQDLLRDKVRDERDRQRYDAFLLRCFDCMEIAYCSEWSDVPGDTAVHELQMENRRLTDEKNRYLAVFESLSEPVFLLDEDSMVLNLNYAAARLLGLGGNPGGSYYGHASHAHEGVLDDSGLRANRTNVIGKPLWQFLPWWSATVLQADKHELDGEMVRVEIEADVFGNSRWLVVAITRMLDVSGRNQGAVAVVTDVTEQREIKEAHKADAERLSLTMDATSDGMWDWNVETGEAFFSPRYYTMLGYEPYEFEPSLETWRGLIHPDDLELAEKTISRHLKKAQPFEMDFRMRTKSGQWRWILGRGKVAARNASGAPTRMVGTHMDFTERRLAEEALARREAQLRGIFENVGSGIALMDLDGVILRANATFAAMTQQDDESAIQGMSFASLLRPDDVDDALAAVAGVGKGLTQTNRKSRVLAGARGGEIWTDQSLSVIRDERGVPASLALVCIDITEQARTRKILEGYSHRLALATQAGKLGVWELDLKDGSLEWDERMLALYKVNINEFSGMYEAWKSRVHPGDVEAAEAALDAAIQARSRFDWEFRIIWPGGEVRTIKAAALIQLDKNDRPDRMIGLNWDITERKRMEDEIRTMAATDPLTGAYNRRKFLELAETEFNRSRRYGQSLAVLMLDIDHFKAINDTHGHHMGDLTLQAFTRTCRETLRENDVFCRLGGEEFAALLVQTGMETALQVAERLRAIIAQTPVVDQGVAVRIRTSIGVAEIHTGDGSVEDVIRHADQALYEAKRQGRDRVVPAARQ